tara:strand:- start:259 stop:579 length:321 start_codon:yes stop_codon:yes gene_type:complete
MNKEIQNKIKLGFKNDRFRSLIGWNDNGLHSWMYQGIGKDIWVIESENDITKYYSRFNDAINLYLKRVNPSQIDIDIDGSVAWYNDYIPLADVDTLDNDDLLEVSI